MKVDKRLALGAAAIAALGIAIPSFASNNGTTKSSSGTQVQDCGNGHTVSLTGPEVLFPPNHKFVNESATATGSNPTDLQSSLTITPQVQDIAGGDGGPTHDPDFAYPSGSPTATDMSGSVTEPFQLRAERSGKGDGRTYVIDWMASWNEGAFSCSSTDGNHKAFTVTVPHDQGNN